MLHQQHIVFHELGHILRGHPAPRVAGVDLTKVVAQGVDTDGETPRALGRDVYSSEIEYEAELMATLILRRVGAHTDDAATTTGVPDDPANPVSRVERSLLRPGR